MVKSEVITKNGKYQGKAIIPIMKPEPVMSCTYKDNKLDGILLRYYQSGYRKELQTYKEGILNGVARTWDRFAHPLQEMYYLSGKPEGPIQEWYRTGY